MRVLVTGDRNWHDVAMVKRIVARLVERYGPDLVIVHGGATGVDAAFASVAESMGIFAVTYRAGWERHGKAAGPIRNQTMVDDGADLCIAVHRFLAKSKGTKDCARRAIAADIPTYLVDSEDVVPVRLSADDPRLK